LGGNALLREVDTTLFQVLTAGPAAPGWLGSLAWGLASGVVPLVAVGLLVAWMRGLARFSLLDAVAAGLLGLGVVQVMGALAYRARPFEVGLGLNLMHHVPENSFPSDHATLMFALAASLYLSRLRRLGIALAGLGIGVGWGRIYLGAHFPGDILGGAVLGLLSALAVKQVPWRLPLWGLIERIHTRLIGRLT
jgi:undecaprenyl-diphosphatase